MLPHKPGMTDAELDKYIDQYVANLRVRYPTRAEREAKKKAKTTPGRPLTVAERYMGRQLTMSAVLGNDHGAKKVILYDVRYKLELVTRHTTTTQTECFAELGDYVAGTRICFMATLGQYRNPNDGRVHKRLVRFKRVYVVP
jgi:hypothetical protein